MGTYGLVGRECGARVLVRLVACVIGVDYVLSLANR